MSPLEQIQFFCKIAYNAGFKFAGSRWQRVLTGAAGSMLSGGQTRNDLQAMHALEKAMGFVPGTFAHGPVTKNIIGSLQGPAADKKPELIRRLRAYMRPPAPVA